jgi:hypothetical protein
LIIELRRLEKTDKCIIGSLQIDDLETYSTLENPDLENQRFISCVPAATYLCRRTTSPKFGETFEILVPDRDHILFHAGNTAKDTSGCILIGSHTGWLNGNRAVLSSRKAVKRFMEALADVDSFTIKITEDFGNDHS